jgi:Protein of unknown function (DUF1036)
MRMGVRHHVCALGFAGILMSAGLGEAKAQTTDLIFCNKTGSKISIAVAWVNHQTGKWMMGAWYSRNPGECKSHGSVRAGLFYYHAQKVGQNYSWPAQANVDKTYCVPTRGVREMANSSCGQGERRFGFQGKVATAGKYTFSFN